MALLVHIIKNLHRIKRNIIFDNKTTRIDIRIGLRAKKEYYLTYSIIR